MEKHHELFNSIVMSPSANDIPEAEPLPENVVNQIQSVKIDEKFTTVIDSLVDEIDFALPIEGDDDYQNEMHALLSAVEEFLEHLKLMVYLELPDDQKSNIFNILLQLVYNGHDLVDKAIDVDEYLTYLQSDTVREHLLLPFNPLLNQAPANDSELQAVNLGAYFAQDHFDLLNLDQKVFISDVTVDARKELGHLGAREYYNQLSSDHQQRLVLLAPKELESNVRNDVHM